MTNIKNKVHPSYTQGISKLEASMRVNDEIKDSDFKLGAERSFINEISQAIDPKKDNTKFFEFLTGFIQRMFQLYQSHKLN